MRTLVLCTVLPVLGAEYYVASGGDDANPGTKQRPFRHIQKAADVMVAGDTCFVRAGSHRETVRPRKSGAEGKPVRFSAYPGEAAVLAGTERITGDWMPYKGSIFRIKTGLKFSQLFLDRKMMIEARWPNMRFEELWDRSKWGRAGAGSAHGKVVDPELAKTGLDWTGALATLNVAHQFYTWTRTVTRHTRGSDAFEYPQDLPVLAAFATRTTGWDDDRYFLSGKLEALDSPGEFFLDSTSGFLYLWPPDGKSPTGRQVEVKTREYGFEVNGLDYIELSGFHFFGTTFRFENSSHSAVEGCHLLYPSYARELTDMDAVAKPLARTAMAGSHNTIRNSSLAYSSTGGFEMSGGGNVLENTLIHDVCWNGSLRYVGASLSTPSGPGGAGPSIARRNTIFRTGNTGLSFHGPTVVEYNHVYDGGLACKDVSLVYTQHPETSGSVVRYNWVHGCRTEEPHGGLGIRGDDQTRGLTVHHNVVWGAGRDGIIVKGDNNKVYNNTVLKIGGPDWTGNYVNLPTEPEPRKPWRKQYPLLEIQNVHSEVFNNAARTITGTNNGAAFPEGPNNASNYLGEDPQLENPENFDFRPKAGSPLIDRGRVLPGFTDGYAGKAPDIGAYEFGGERWAPGCRSPMCVSAGVVRDGKMGR